jgi:aldehyde dehydrogenase (NAD+)
MKQNYIDGAWVDGASKGASYGSREQGSYAAEFFTTVKTAYCGV